MSSFTSLSRTRSLRKPAAAELGGGSEASKQTRNTSPSRLPIKPPPSGGATSTSAAAGRTASASAASSSSSMAATTATKARSGIFSRLNATSRSSAASHHQQRQGSENADPSAAATARGAASTTASGRRPPTSSSSSFSIQGPGTGPAAARPKTSGGLPSTAAATKPRTTTAAAGAGGGHSRTRSSATVLTDATVLRPPPSSSLLSFPLTSAAASTAAAATAAGADVITSTRPPLSNANLPRTGGPTTLHRRAPSNPSSLSRGGGVSGEPTRHQQQARPAFNTLQQHYSPLKSLAPKPPVSAYLAPPSPSKLPANVALSAEASRLQTELLQLHLLHRAGSGAVLSGWHASARASLGRRFAEVVEADDGVGRAEARVCEERNARALRSWGGHHHGDDAGGKGGGGGGGGEGGGGDAASVGHLLEERAQRLEERVQRLDEVLCGLWTLGEPGGRYARVVRRFEKWVAVLKSVVERREEGFVADSSGGDVDIFVCELDPAWRDECEGLVRKLDGWRRALRDLDGPGDGDRPGAAEGEEPSSLARILAGCRSLVHDMLAELNVMAQIERDALRQESEWIEETNRDDAGDDTPRAGAIWRVF